MNNAHTAIVTGAGAGTGREYVRLLLASGFRVVAVSLLPRELDALREDLATYADRLHTLQMDLAEPDAAVMLLNWCDQRGFDIGVLINNAGFACYGPPTDIDMSRVNAMMRLNVVAMTEVAMVFAGRMKTRRSGRILIMGSTAGMVPSMNLSAYCASKAYTNMFAYGLGAELRPFGVTVTLVTPGTFQSNFARTAGLDTTQGITPLERRYRKEKVTATEIAEAGYRGLLRRKATVTVGKNTLAIKAIGRFIPLSVQARVFRTY